MAPWCIWREAPRPAVDLVRSFGQGPRPCRAARRSTRRVAGAGWPDGADPTRGLERRVCPVAVRSWSGDRPSGPCLPMPSSACRCGFRMGAGCCGERPESLMGGACIRRTCAAAARRSWSCRCSPMPRLPVRVLAGWTLPGLYPERSEGTGGHLVSAVGCGSGQRQGGGVRRDRRRREPGPGVAGRQVDGVRVERDRRLRGLHPPVPRGPWGVAALSLDRGLEPRWSADGRQLYFLRPVGFTRGTLQEARVDDDGRGGLRTGTPQPLFDSRSARLVPRVNWWTTARPRTGSDSW